jgi:hypothetical protein
VRYLKQDPDTVADFAAGILAGPVAEMFHDAKGIIYRTVRSSSVNIDDGADPAGIVLHVFFPVSHFLPPDLQRQKSEAMTKGPGFSYFIPFRL